MQTVEIGSSIRRLWWVLPYICAAYLLTLAALPFMSKATAERWANWNGDFIARRGFKVQTMVQKVEDREGE